MDTCIHTISDDLDLEDAPLVPLSGNSIKFLVGKIKYGGTFEKAIHYKINKNLQCKLGFEGLCILSNLRPTKMLFNKIL